MNKRFRCLPHRQFTLPSFKLAHDENLDNEIKRKTIVKDISVVETAEPPRTGLVRHYIGPPHQFRGATGPTRKNILEESTFKKRSQNFFFPFLLFLFLQKINTSFPFLEKKRKEK